MPSAVKTVIKNFVPVISYSSPLWLFVKLIVFAFRVPHDIVSSSILYPQLQPKIMGPESFILLSTESGVVLSHVEFQLLSEWEETRVIKYYT